MFNLLMIILFVTICQGRSRVKITDERKHSFVCNYEFTAVESAHIEGMW
jgi:hypothetical protein